MTFTENSKILRHSASVAAGTTDVEPSNGIDMTGFESVTFLASFGAIVATAVTSVKAQQSSDDGVADAWSDLEGTSISVADDDDDQVVALEIVNPSKRYVRCVVDRGTANAELDGIVALISGPKVAPVTHDSSTVVGSEVHATPAEGTA